MGIPAPREVDLYAPILDAIAIRGGFAWRVNSGTVAIGGRRIRFNGCPGHPDIAGMTATGRALFVEVKHGRGKLTLEQASFIEKAERHGALCIVAYSLDDVTRALREG